MGRRLSLSLVPRLPESSTHFIPGGFDHPVALDNTARQRERGVSREPLAPREPSSRLSEAPPDQNYHTPEGGSAPRPGRRARRHANRMVGRSHAQLMRVGCVLGTCSGSTPHRHRLYQLIGQGGREDFLPHQPTQSPQLRIAPSLLSLSLVPRLPESSTHFIPGGFDHPVALDNTARQRERGVSREPLAPREPSSRLSEAPPDQNYHTSEGGSAPRPGRRARRHANRMVGRSHAQLMRVGCVLGTCQVQHLSHRLYQLIGQGGREDSSPINPRSPHSYG
ncbi:hypothetical protein CRUP_007620 [Coryphaenoides rupestris]|nr:hypothetical protein CRUP_007620 [Coryphaenoides rupestris]